LKQWLLEQALQLIDRFPNAVSDDWKLSALIKLMPLAEDISFGDNLMKRVRKLILTGKIDTYEEFYYFYFVVFCLFQVT